MNEKDKLSFNEGDEEEFHITDEDIDRELAAMETDQPASASDATLTTEEMTDKSSVKKRFAAFKQLKRKHWMIIIIIMIMLVFGLLKFISSNQSSTSFDQIAPVITTTPAVAVKKTTESNPLTDLTTAPTMTTPTTPSTHSAVENKQLTSNLSTIAGNEAKLTDALQEIQQQNKALTQQLSQLSNRVVSLESVLNSSSQTVESLSQQVGSMQKQTAPSMVSSPLPPQVQTLPQGPQYTTEAVVPQRAWIQTSDGNTITVTLGDELPGLGAVVSIDPYTGNVTTASGTVVKYGS